MNTIENLNDLLDKPIKEENKISKTKKTEEKDIFNGRTHRHINNLFLRF